MSHDQPQPQDRPAEQPPASQPPQAPTGPPQYQPQQYQQPQYQQPQYQHGSGGQVQFQPAGSTVEHPQATLAFVLGLLSVLGVLIVGPFGWWFGRKVVREIDLDPRPYSNRGLAMAGMVLGIIGTVFLILAVALFATAIVAAVLVGGSSAGY